MAGQLRWSLTGGHHRSEFVSELVTGSRRSDNCEWRLHRQRQLDQHEHLLSIEEMKRLDCIVLQSELLYQIGKPHLHTLESSADAARGFRLLSGEGLRTVLLALYSHFHVRSCCRLERR